MNEKSGPPELEEDLRHADLGRIPGLLPEHLARRDLTGAKLPFPHEIPKYFLALEQVKAISAEARKVFVGLLAACVYSWLVIGTTRDVALILNTAGSPLPIINTPIPTGGFYVVGAAILAAVYCYLHFYLQRLWRTLATLPAIFPDGVAIDDKTDPWLLTNLARTEFRLLRPPAPPLARLENLLAVFLTWWLVPLTLLALWARYLPAHGWLGTSWLVFLIGLATLFGRHTYRLARDALQGQPPRTPEPTDAADGILARAWRELRGLRLDKLTGWLTIGVVVCSISAFRDNPRDPYTWVAKGLNAFSFIGIRTYADLREVDVAQKPDGWDGKDWSKVGQVDLRGRNLAFADLTRAFLAKADLRGSNLIGVRFDSAALQGADFTSDDQLTGASFVDAQLQGAKLSWTILQGNELRRAHLDGADLTGAEMQGADLDGASLQGVDLHGARLDTATLSKGQLHGADLRGASLRGAYLEDAQLQGADLWTAPFDLQSPPLKMGLRKMYVSLQTHLDGAILIGASLWRADWQDGWKSVDLRWSNVEPIEVDQAKALISRTLVNIPDEQRRKEVSARLTSALLADGRDAKPKSPYPWHSDDESEATTTDEEQATIIGNLACERGQEAQPLAIAKRVIGRRGLHPKIDVLARDLEIHSCLYRLLARRLAGPDCPASVRLPFSLLDQIRETSSPQGSGGLTRSASRAIENEARTFSRGRHG